MVTEKCHQALEILAPEGGFILRTECALPANTPMGNIDPLIESCRNIRVI